LTVLPVSVHHVATTFHHGLTGTTLHDRINRRGARPATPADVPGADELIAAFQVPTHRHAALRQAYAAYSKRRDVSDGIVSSIRVSDSRGEGRLLRDRIRHLGAPRREQERRDADVQTIELTTAGLLISRGRGHLVVYEHGQRGALAIGASLRSLPLSPVTLGAHYLGQRIIDGVLGGTAELDDERDMAHGWATWLSLVLADENPAQVDADAVAGWSEMLQASAIDIREASSLLMRIVHMVEADGPYIDRGGDGDIVDRLWTQLALDDLLDQVFADPAVVAAAKQKKRELKDLRRDELASMAEREAEKVQMLLFG
jgi:hypothetical protein